MPFTEGHPFYPGTKLFPKGHIPWNKGIGSGRKWCVYPKEFYDEEFRENIKKRDGYVCQCCGITDEEHLIVFGKGLSIHHIDYIKENMSLDNLITLCNACNVRANFNKSYWIEYYKCFVPDVLGRRPIKKSELRPHKMGAL